MSRINDQPMPRHRYLGMEDCFAETIAAPIQARDCRNTKKKRAEWRQKNDVIAILEKDLTDMKAKLKGEQLATDTACNKLIQVRLELAQEKFRFQNVERELHQDLHTVRSRMQATIDQQNKAQQAHSKALEEHARSKVSLQQLLEMEMKKRTEERQVQQQTEDSFNLQLQAKESQLQQVLTAQQEADYQSSQTIADLKQKLQDSQSHFASLSQELDASKQRLEEKDNMLRKKHDEQQGVERRSEEERLKLQRNTDMLLSQVKNANQQLQDYDRQLGILRGESESLRNGLARAEEQKGSMVGELAALKNSNGKMLNDKRILDERLSELQQALVEEREESKRLKELKAEADIVNLDLSERLHKVRQLQRDAERHRRKIETELNGVRVQNTTKHAQVVELQQQLCKREDDLSQVLIKCAEDAAAKAQAQKISRDIANQLVEVQRELESAKAARDRPEKQKRDLNDELEALKNQLLDTTAALRKVQAKREMEMTIFNKTLRDNSTTHEMQIASLQQKHVQAMEQLNEQVEALEKTKTNLQKVKTDLESGIEVEKGTSQVLAAQNKKTPAYRSGFGRTTGRRRSCGSGKRRICTQETCEAVGCEY